VGTAPNPADVEDGLNQVGNLEPAVEPMPTFTSVNLAPCRVGPPHSDFTGVGQAEAIKRMRNTTPASIRPPSMRPSRPVGYNRYPIGVHLGATVRLLSGSVRRLMQRHPT